MKVIFKSNNIKSIEKKCFALSKIDIKNIFIKINEIEIYLSEKKFCLIEAIDFNLFSIDKNVSTVEKNEKKIVSFIKYNNEKIGKIVKNKKNYICYLNITFLNEFFNLNLIKKENKKLEKINKEKLLNSLLNNNIQEFVYQCSKIVDVVLHSKKVNYYLYEDFKQELLMRVLNFYNKKNTYNLQYDMDKIFNYIYKMVSNYYINILKKKVYREEIFYI